MLKNDEVDYCTKCTIKPIAKEHMCEECEAEHNQFMEEHYEARNSNGIFVAREPVFEEIKYRLFDRDKNITQIYTLQELIAKTYRREKFEFRGRYTGLKDKNGVEIYEGDIVQGGIMRATGDIEIYNSSTTVHFKSGMFKCGGVSLNSYSNKVEVIGSIYENSDLLEDEVKC